MTYPASRAGPGGDFLVRPVGGEESRRAIGWGRVVAAGAALVAACLCVGSNRGAFVRRSGGGLLEGGTWDEGLPYTPLPHDAVYQTQHAVAVSIARLLSKVDGAYAAYEELEKTMAELKAKEADLQGVVDRMRQEKEERDRAEERMRAREMEQREEESAREREREDRERQRGYGGYGGYNQMHQEGQAWGSDRARGGGGGGYERYSEPVQGGYDRDWSSEGRGGYSSHGGSWGDEDRGARYEDRYTPQLKQEEAPRWRWAREEEPAPREEEHHWRWLKEEVKEAPKEREEEEERAPVEQEKPTWGWDDEEEAPQAEDIKHKPAPQLEEDKEEEAPPKEEVEEEPAPEPAPAEIKEEPAPEPAPAEKHHEEEPEKKEAEEEGGKGIDESPCAPFC